MKAALLMVLLLAACTPGPAAPSSIPGCAFDEAFGCAARSATADGLVRFTLQNEMREPVRLGGATASANGRLVACTLSTDVVDAGGSFDGVCDFGELNGPTAVSVSLSYRGTGPDSSSTAHGQVSAEAR